MSATQPDPMMLVKTISERELPFVKLGLTDIDGVMRGKYVAAADFIAGLQSGLGFCSCIVGWDCDDLLYTNNPDGITGWHTGYPDIPITAIPGTARTLPHEFDGRGMLVLAEMAGEAADVCPRTMLRRVVEQADAMGFDAHVGFEYEFSLFTETRESARAKHFRGLNPISPGNFGYSLLRAANFSELCEALLRDCATMGVPLVAFHTENGPGIWEAAIGASDALTAADRAATFKTFAKAFAQRHGLIATFMAKPSAELQGQGGHMHISLREKGSGRPLFFDGREGNASSEIMRHFIAGQLALMPELTAMVAPSVNSYTRLLPGAWAPTAATSGEDNRTCALRLVGRAAGSRRVEYRVAGADANPYLALAAALASGLHGIREALEPPPPLTGNAYEVNAPKVSRLPATLAEAAERLRQSQAARDWFGDIFVDHFALSRDWEEQRFRAAVTSWELERYFEII